MSISDDRIVENFEWSRTLLTEPRLRPYLSAMNENLDGALQLYVINVAASSEIYQWLGILEIYMRNAMVSALRNQAADVTKDPFLTHWKDLTRETKNAYLKAANRLSVKGKSLSFDTLISELPFSFWRYLLSSKYESTLWTSHFRHAFPSLHPRRRTVVYEAVESVVYLRNRIAHHEPIFRRELGRDLSQIQQIIGWISPEALAWAQVNLPTRLISSLRLS